MADRRTGKVPHVPDEGGGKRGMTLTTMEVKRMADRREPERSRTSPTRAAVSSRGRAPSAELGGRSAATLARSARSSDWPHACCTCRAIADLRA